MRPRRWRKWTRVTRDIHSGHRGHPVPGIQTGRFVTSGSASWRHASETTDLPSAFSTNKEVYFAGVRLYAHKDEGRQFSVQLKISRCQGLKEEASAVSGTFTVKGEPRDGGRRLGFDVLVPKPFVVSREAQFIIKITITGIDETRSSPNKGIPMKFVKCEGVEFKFEGQSRQILELLFYPADLQSAYHHVSH